MSRLKLREQRPPSIRGARLKDDLLKPGTEPGTQRGTTLNKPGTEPGTGLTAKKAFSGEPGTEPGTQLGASQNRTRYKPGTEPGTVLDSFQVTGLQEKVLKFVFERCRDAGSLKTGIITKSEFKKVCGGTTEGLKRAIQKVEERGYLRRIESHAGIFGGVSFEIFDSVFQKLILQETRYKPGTVLLKPGTEPGTEPGTGLSTGGGGLYINNRSSSSSDNERIKANAEWKNIEVGSLSEIGFTETHVNQIAHAGHLTPEELQISIYAFAFDLEVNKKTFSSSLNYFMKCLRNGPYAPPANYESPKQRQMRLYLEAKEREQKQNLELEARLQSVQFEDWAARLSLAEKEQLVPQNDFARPGSQAHTIQLKQYFRETVWPQFREKILEELK